MSEINLANYKKSLEEFLHDYKNYIDSYYLSDYGREDLKTKLQRQSKHVSQIINVVHGGCSLKLSKTDSINFYQALAYILTNNVTDKTRHFLESNVEATLNEAIGNIENNTIPLKNTIPALPIKDSVLKKRCLDLLSAPGSFDRVINQATLVLEDRLRSRIPYEKFCELVPEAKNHIGVNLAHKLLAPPNPLIVVSNKPEERSAFHEIIVGVIAYLRNPTHHAINDDTEWALAWSVVGIVDSLIYEIDNSYTIEEMKEKKEK